MEEVDTWEAEAAAMLSQIGFAILPWGTMQKIYQGLELTDHEKELFKTHSTIASDLIAKIPRLEKVAEIIAFQEKNYDGSGFPPVHRKKEEIPLGSRLLKVALDFDALEAGGCAKEKALDRLKTQAGSYDPKVLSALEKVIRIEAAYEVQSLPLSALTEKMVLADDIRTVKGVLMISKGQEISLPILQRLKQLVSDKIIPGPIRIMAGD
jgi:response regulator RpfG family c-di-GMP phosphodiesterase